MPNANSPLPQYLWLPVREAGRLTFVIPKTQDIVELMPKISLPKNELIFFIPS